MDPNNNLVDAMNNISLEDEDEGGLLVDPGLLANNDSEGQGFNADLCIVGRFLSEGKVDFPAMQQTLACLWRPGMGVYMKELEVNLFLFQFYHEVDVKRVMEGCPWSFNRKALIMRRLKNGDNPRGVILNNLELWVQVYDLKVGFMTEKILTEIGNSLGGFITSCPSNFSGTWREYFRIRVNLDVTKPLKRRMKIKKADEDWFWISFKYENVPTFCFICGVLGHSDKFCTRLFTTAEADIVKPFGSWMRAPFRRQTKPIGAKWLHNGSTSSDRKTDENQSQVQHGGEASNPDPIITPQNQAVVNESGNFGDKEFQKSQTNAANKISTGHQGRASIMPTNVHD